MTRRTSRTTTLTLRLVETIESEDDFNDDEHPSLSGIPTYDTTGDDITHVRAAGLRKCGPLLNERKRVAK